MPKRTRTIGTLTERVVAEGRTLPRPLSGSIVGDPDDRLCSLDELVKGISTRNRHSETPTGRRRGRESW